MDSEKTKMAYGELFILLAGASLLIISVVSYLWVFIPASNHTLSNNHEAWASFGSFFGGTIGPIISGLAFFYVWKTFSLQSEQLKEMKQSVIINEFQRAIDDKSNKLDILFAMPLSGENKHEVPNVGIALEVLMKSTLGDTKLTADHILLLTDIESDLDIDFVIIHQIFKNVEELCLIFDQYIKYGGSEDLYKIYKRKNEYSINGLHHLGTYKDKLDDASSHNNLDEYKSAISTHYPIIIE
ncbi:hypothetical protein [Aeromonas rivipollensis]|uniref:hypothetical protein n=1 Tax=Aeromonas rivipollensis TaxID=948519 RepID=UPI003D19AFC8